MGAIRDIRSQLKPNIAFKPQVVNTDTTTIGEIVDSADFDGGIVFTQFINWTAGVLTPLIEESDSATFASGVTAVVDENLIGDVSAAQEADAALTNTQLVSSLGVVNNAKRYLRLKIVSSGTANAVVGATCHKHQELVPISNP